MSIYNEVYGVVASMQKADGLTANYFLFKMFFIPLNVFTLNAML